MNVTVKVLLGQKLYKLTPAANTLALVKQEMKNRFPELQALQFYHQGQLVTNLENLIQQTKQQRQTSLKLTAKEEISQIEQVSKEQSSNEIQPLKEEPQLDKQSSIKSINESVIEASLPSEFYLCYECEGKGHVLEISFNKLCSVCKGKGTLYEHHKYIQRLHKLFFNRESPFKKNEEPVEKPKVEEIEEVPIKKSFYDGGIDKNYEVIVTETTKKEKVQMGKLFTMRFQIKNIGQDWEQRDIQVIECGKTQGKRVSALKSGGIMHVEFGPFVCKTDNVLEKTYSLFYKEGNELIRFGHKFGFSVRGAKKIGLVKNDSFEKEREKIEVLKAISGSKKSEEFLSLKLKSLGINLLDTDLDDESLIDIINQIK